MPLSLEIAQDQASDDEGMNGKGWTLETAFTLANIHSLQKHKGERTNTMLIDRWLPLVNIESYTILGSFAWTSPSVKQKWLLKTNARFDAAWVSPADRARDYLTVNGFKKQKRRVTRKQYDAVISRRRSHPLYAEPAVLPDAVYIDIKSAYWSILSIVGWDVDYFPGKWLGVASSVSDFPFKEDKLARNSLVSIGLPGYLKVWTGQKLAFAKRQNPFTNMVLWSLVHDVLHGVAADVIAAGAVYAFTDGFIASADREGAIIDAISAWGLPADVRHRGKAVVRGVGDYDIADRQSKRPRAIPTPFNNLIPVHPKWLRGKMRRWYERSTT